jgi:hypothetical protein
MCPKMNETVSDSSVSEQHASFIDRIKSKFNKLHRVTICALIFYGIFVMIFICFNILTCAWHFTMRGKQSSIKSKYFCV